MDHIESLITERLRNPSPPSRPQLPSDPPPPQRPRKRKKRPRADRRIKAFRDSVAQKAKAAEQAAIAIATVRPLRKSLPPTSPTKSPPETSPTPVSTIKVKQLPSVCVPKSTKSIAEQNASAAPPLVDAANFVDAHRTEIGDFGSQALRRRDRKKYQVAKLVKLGCRLPKNQKLPIALLQKRRKREKQNAHKQKQRDLATGMLLRTKRT